MFLNEWLSQNVHSLTDAGIGTARLDCLVLLEDCLGKDRAHLLAHPEIELSDEQVNILTAYIQRRLTHEPLSYIRGKTEFYGRDFAVNKNVLEPRPESETMIDLLKNLTQVDSSTSARIADIGSGSGSLGITAALELGLESADFYDIDPTTLKVAKSNAWTHHIQGQFFESDLLASGHGPYDFILANLPYVPDNFPVNQAATREPPIALYGGSDGLELYRKLFKQLGTANWKPKYVFTEALPPQHDELIEIAEVHGFVLTTDDDFIQVFSPTRQITASLEV